MKTTNLRNSFQPRLAILPMAAAIFALLAGCSSAVSTPGSAAQPSQVVQPSISLATQPSAPAATEAPAGPAIDACSLLTKAEVEAALGKSVGAPQPENFPGNYSCKFVAADQDNVSLNVIVSNSAQEAADAFQAELDLNHYKEVSGIGDRAMRPSPIFDIAVLKGRYELSIVIYSASGDAESNFQKARTLAEAALARLP